MYFKQEIEVNLTAENTQILRRPSKFFNKMKSVFSGNMTPNEARQAEVLVSVLQRLNIALKEQGINNLVSISVNGKELYGASKNSKVDVNLADGQTALVNSFSAGDVTSVDHMELVSEAVEGEVRYIVDVSIRRKPKGEKTPLSLTVIGLLNHFQRGDGEQHEAMLKRLKTETKKRWRKYATLGKGIKSLEVEFLAKVDAIQGEINRHFPALSNKQALKTRVVSSTRSGAISETYAYFEDDLYYLPLWFELIQDVAGDGDSLAEELGWEEEPITIGADFLFDNDDDSKSNDSGSWISDSPSYESDSAASCSSCSSCSSCGGD